MRPSVTATLASYFHLSQEHFAPTKSCQAPVWCPNVDTATMEKAHRGAGASGRLTQ